jgi:predicted transcriptional regulator
MPKIYASKEERQKAKIIRDLTGMAKGKQSKLADLWGISQPAVSHRLNTGNVSIMDLYEARHVFGVDEIDDLIRDIIGKG